MYDTARQVIAERRMTLLLRLGQYIASSREPKDFWQQLLRCLKPELAALSHSTFELVGAPPEQSSKPASGHSIDMHAQPKIIRDAKLARIRDGSAPTKVQDKKTPTSRRHPQTRSHRRGQHRQPKRSLQTTSQRRIYRLCR